MHNESFLQVIEVWADVFKKGWKVLDAVHKRITGEKKQRINAPGVRFHGYTSLFLNRGSPELG